MSRTRQKLDRCVRETAERAWRLASARLGDPRAADEAVQETFLVAARKPAEIPDGNPWPWIAGVLLNVCRRIRAGDRRPRAVSLEKTTAALDLPDGREPAPFARLAETERRERLRDALDSLPDPEREAILATRLADVPYREAARVLGTPMSTLASRVRNGMERLRRRLRGTDEDVGAGLAILLFAPPPEGHERARRRWLRSATPRPRVVGWLAAAAIALLLLLLPLSDLLPGGGNANADAPVDPRPPGPVARGGPEERPAPGRGAPADPQERRFEISGICYECERDEESKLRMTTTPIPNARVWFERKGKTHETRSAADGTFRLSVPEGRKGWVYVAHPEYYTRRIGPERVRKGRDRPPPRAGEIRMEWPADHARLSGAKTKKVDGPLEGLTLGAERGVILVGTVRGGDGEPVPGARVRAIGGADHLILDTATDADGRFRIGAFMPKNRTGLVVQARGYQLTGRISVPLGAAGTQRRDVTLEPAGVLRGRVVRLAKDSRLAGLTIIAEHESNYGTEKRETTTDADGRFHLDTLNAGERYRIVVVDPETRLLVARTDWLTTSAEGAEIEITEAKPAVLSIGIDPAAFTEKSPRYFVLVMPEVTCRSTISGTIREALTWSKTPRRLLTRENPETRFAQRIAMEVRLLAIPADLLADPPETTRKQFTRAEIRRMRVSRPSVVRLGVEHTLVASEPLDGVTIRGRVKGREGGNVYCWHLPFGGGEDVSKRHWNTGPKITPLLADGTFRFPGVFWPGDYRFFHLEKDGTLDFQGRHAIAAGRAGDDLDVTVEPPK